MPFVTTPERVGNCSGMRRGIEAMLEKLYGEAGLQLMPQIQKIYEEERLDGILKALVSFGSLTDFCRGCGLTLPESAD